MYSKIKTFALPILSILGLILVILWMAGSFDQKIQPGEKEVNSDYQGEFYTVQESLVQLNENIPATVRSKQTTHVASRILAVIKSIHVKAGDSVNKGDLLIELDNRNNRANVAQSIENINSIKARLVQAESHYKRSKTLYNKESVTKAQLEQASANFNSLKAQLASARQQLQSSQTTSSYSQIRAQFAARVIDRFAETGDLASPGMKLLTLYDPLSLRIDANVRESLAFTLSIGQQLETYIPALKQTLMATIEEIVPAADPGARSFLIKAKIEHNAKLLPGLFARLKIPSAKQHQILIPNHYIKQMGQLDVVWVLENNQAVRRFIRTGLKSADHTRVISGLTEGDKLVLVDNISP